PDAAAVEELPVMRTGSDDLPGQREHERRVRAGPDRQPHRGEVRMDVVAHGRDVHETDPGRATAALPTSGVVPADAARVGPGVLGRHAAEADDELAVRLDLGPARTTRPDAPRRAADDVR